MLDAFLWLLEIGGSTMEKMNNLPDLLHIVLGLLWLFLWFVASILSYLVSIPFLLLGVNTVPIAFYCFVGLLVLGLPFSFLGMIVGGSSSSSSSGFSTNSGNNVSTKSDTGSNIKYETHKEIQTTTVVIIAQEVRACPNCGNTREGDSIVRCKTCGNITCKRCHGDTCKNGCSRNAGTVKTFFDSNLEIIGKTGTQ